MPPRFPVAVHLFLLRDERVPLLRRANTGFADGMWSVPAGHVERGETIVAALESLTTGRWYQEHGWGDEASREGASAATEGAAPLFDAYLVVDWSASSVRKTGRDSIWAAGVTRFEDEWLENLPTRARAEDAIKDRLERYLRHGSRVLVGFDFPYGYPAGFAAAGDGSSREPWRSNWDEITAVVSDDARNRNNRFEAAAILNARRGDRQGPFWGCPSRQGRASLGPKGCGFPWVSRRGTAIERLRVTEKRARGVQESWKLFGAGSVGSQALVGIPRVHRLRFAPELSSVSRVWPFETGFTATPTLGSGARIVHAEIWPGVAGGEPAAHPIRDASQVLTLARELARLDSRGKLGERFDRPKGLTALEAEACLAEEGWILGV